MVIPNAISTWVMGRVRVGEDGCMMVMVILRVIALR